MCFLSPMKWMGVMFPPNPMFLMHFMDSFPKNETLSYLFRNNIIAFIWLAVFERGRRFIIYTRIALSLCHFILLGSIVASSEITMRDLVYIWTTESERGNEEWVYNSIIWLHGDVFLPTTTNTNTTLCILYFSFAEKIHRNYIIMNCILISSLLVRRLWFVGNSGWEAKSTILAAKWMRHTFTGFWDMAVTFMGKVLGGW